MRIVTGAAKGRKLITLEGLHTRPTGDKVKQAVFSALQCELEGRTVLDLFAGSGQLGLEALSRGARACVFVENDRDAQAVVERNIRTCALDGARLEKAEALTFLARQKRNSFQLIFLDPPYGAGLLEQAVESICRFDILTSGGIMVCESRRGEFAPAVAEPYRVTRRCDYGSVSVTYIVRD